MHKLLKSVLTAAFIGGAALLMPLASQAQFLEITISDTLGHTLTVADGAAGDSNPLAGAIGIDSALLAAFPNLNMGSNVTASIQQGPVTIFSTSGNLFGNTDARFTVNSSANNLTLPDAPFFRHFDSTDTFLYAGGSAGASGTTKDGVQTANVLHGQDISDIGFTYVSTGFASNSGSSGAGHNFEFNNGNMMYAITSITGIDVQANNALSQYQSNDVVTAGVPEPGAMALLAGVGLSGSLFALRLRRRRK